MRRVQPDGPYQLGGWSFGGLVAYEMAQQLRAAGADVALLALLDTVAPGAQARAGLGETAAFLTRTIAAGRASADEIG